MKLISSHNIFIDTSRANDESTSKGDDYRLHLNTQSVDAERGQYMKLTLNEFNMYKNFTDVNVNNDEFTLITNAATTSEFIVNKNYATLHDLATQYSTQLAALLLIDAIALGSAATQTVVLDIQPNATTSINGTTDNIISFIVEFRNAGGTAVAHNITQADIILLEGKGDSFELLGGDRSDGTANSVNTTITANQITFIHKYPAQRNTQPFIYLRTSLTTGATENAALSTETDVATNSQASYSNILARIPVNTEFCTYKQQSDNEFFINLHQKHLNNIRLYLTDQHNRRIGRRPANLMLNTASGTGTSQSILGNLSFSAVLRIDIIEARQPAEQMFEPAVNTAPPRSTNLFLNPPKLLPQP